MGDGNFQVGGDVGDGRTVSSYDGVGGGNSDNGSCETWRATE